MFGGLYVTTYAADVGEETGHSFAERCRWWLRGVQGRARYGFLEVSEEYEAEAISIATESGDPDVDALLAEGYSVKGGRPLIKSIVDGNSDVTTTATNAIVILENESIMSHAAVWVDLDTDSVTKIVIVTRTVIDKS
jgi:hypothetical protein